MKGVELGRCQWWGRGRAKTAAGGPVTCLSARPLLFLWLLPCLSPLAPALPFLAHVLASFHGSGERRIPTLRTTSQPLPAIQEAGHNHPAQAFSH